MTQLPPPTTRPAEVVVALLVITLDQLTKWLVNANIDPYESVPVIEGLFELTHLRNEGGVWGIGNRMGDTLRLVLFIILPGFVAAAAAWYGRHLDAGDVMRRCSIALVVGGAVGNLADRIRLGGVVDFIHVYWRDFSWPAFNVADSAICTGVAILLVSSFFEHEPEPEPESAPPAAEPAE